MKKHIIIATFLICILALFAACNNSSDTENSTPSTQAETTTSPVSSSEKQYPEYQAGSFRLEPRDTDDYPFERKYRLAYYRIWGQYYDLLDEGKRESEMAWIDAYGKEEGNGATIEEMMLVTLVKRNNITREQFDGATQKLIDHFINEMEFDLNYEEYEIPNGDIIYSFDNDLINHYYRYE